jgi:hypothetical protein
LAELAKHNRPSQQERLGEVVLPVVLAGGVKNG